MNKVEFLLVSNNNLDQILKLSFQPSSPASGLAVGSTRCVLVMKEVIWVVTRLVEVMVV